MIIQSVPVRASSWSLSFSGAGHLISYHLGVALTLQNKNNECSIKNVAGSSSGAIVAAVMACFPHQLDEYTDRFLQDGGRAYANFNEMLSESSTNEQLQEHKSNLPLLHVATTSCSDGSQKVFSFEPVNLHLKPDKMLLALQASCRIPVSFHPWDIFSRRAPSYPELDGIEIEGGFYVDGGIASPCPMLNESDSTYIAISPISGSSSAKWSIRPVDTSWKLPLVGDLTARCRTFAVRPSVNNLNAFAVSAGVASPQILKDWHDRGVHDANIFIEKWNWKHCD
jgi:predicted patatin/cPLA2 family phospholipase